MDIKNILQSCFPRSVKKDADIFSTLIVSNTNEPGAIENELLKVQNYIKETINIKSIYDIKGETSEDEEYFNHILKFFFPKNLLSSSANDNLMRIKSLFNRHNYDEDKEISIWGTAYDIIATINNIFKYTNDLNQEATNYFEILEHQDIDKNLIINGDFEQNFINWHKSSENVSDIYCIKGVRFSGDQSAAIAKNKSINQTVYDVQSGTYVLSFFAENRIKVKIYSYNNSEYTLIRTVEVGKYSQNIQTFYKNNYTIFFNLPVVSQGIKIEFTGNNEDNDYSYIDFVCLNKYEYPCFSLIYTYQRTAELYNANQNLFFIQNIKNESDYDYIAPSKYGAINMSAYHGDYVAATNYLDEILDYLRPAGVKASYKIIPVIIDEYAWVEGKNLVLPYGNIKGDMNMLEINKEIIQISENSTIHNA